MTGLGREGTAWVPLGGFGLSKNGEANTTPYQDLASPDGIVQKHLMPTGLYNPGSQLPESMIKPAKQASAPVDPQERAPIYAKLTQ